MSNILCYSIDMKLCSVGTCSRPSRARNYCTKHYQQVMHHGEILKPYDRRCDVSNCNDTHHSRGLCNKHYLQWKIHGNVQPDDNRSAITHDKYAEIPLGKNGCQGYSLVDLEDTELASKYFWANHHGYAGGLVNGKYMSLHRLLMNPPTEMQIDHQNMNTLDNRKSNLRLCTQKDNSRNSGKHKNNTTGHKGVIIWGDRYRAQLGYMGKKLHLGYYDTVEEAARAYDAKAAELHGEFAKLNFNKG